MKNFFIGLMSGIALLTFGFLAGPVVSWAKASKTKVVSRLPERLLCEEKPGRVSLLSDRGRVEWTFPVKGAVLDAQSQPSGDWLVTGGDEKVFLLHHTMGKRPWVSAWDWKALDIAPPVSAVAVDWDLDGKPTLVLAADAVKNRIFLAEAKGGQPKIRWTFPLGQAPRSVRVCPDSGNFLVTLDSQVEEVDFRQEKVIWTVKVPQATDAARSPDSNTYVIDAQGRVSAYDPDQNLIWRTDLDPRAKDWKNTTLSLFQVREEIRILASGTGQTRQGRQGWTWVLDSNNGKILASDETAPNVVRVVPGLDKTSFAEK
ncbi:MAG: YncE family protein [bacterium]